VDYQSVINIQATDQMLISEGKHVDIGAAAKENKEEAVI